MISAVVTPRRRRPRQGPRSAYLGNLALEPPDLTRKGAVTAWRCLNDEPDIQSSSRGRLAWRRYPAGPFHVRVIKSTRMRAPVTSLTRLVPRRFDRRGHLLQLGLLGWRQFLILELDLDLLDRASEAEG